jgi:hypothetical protein
MQSFDDYYNSLKKQICQLCANIDEKTNHRIEYEDLFMEAALKLLQIYRSGKPTDVNYSIRAVKNCLLDYVHKNSNEDVISIGLMNEDYINI